MSKKDTATDTASRSAMAVIGFLVFVELCSGILQGAVPSLVPLIGQQMHVSSGDLSWVNTLPLLVSGISVPLASKLGDIYGHRRLILVTMTAVAVGSILAAVTDSFALLLVGRALQGLFAAWLPLDFAIVRDRVQEGKAGAAIGLLVGAVTLGATLGLVGAGLLSEHFDSAQTLLWFPTIAILLCLPIVWFLVPESVTRLRSRIDWFGAVLLSIGLGCGLLALGRGEAWGWSSARVITLAVLAVVALVLFVLAELRITQPLIDIRMVTNRKLAPLYLLCFILGIGMYGSQTANITFMATPSQFGFGFGYDTLDLSLMVLPLSVAGFLAGGLADRLIKAIGMRMTVGTGFLSFTISYGVLAMAHDHPWQFVVSSVLAGIGLGLVAGALPVIIMGHLPADQTGIGTGLYNTLKAIAGSISGAIFAAVLNRHLLVLPMPGVKLSDEHGYTIVWMTSAVICLIGFAFCALVRPAGHQTEPSPATEPRTAAAVD
ncbi:MFS transporter [Streptomyces sp. NPDC048430]|uniref:MFS transporter n=1 Tax=Streptomyces sp. NPDC048430 TaxID=3155388 RepID=UPI00342D8883